MRAAVGAVRAERPPALGRALTYRCLVLPRAVSFRAVGPLFSNHKYSLHRYSVPLFRRRIDRRVDGVEVVALHATAATPHVDGVEVVAHSPQTARTHGHSATKTGPASLIDRRRPGAGRARSSPPRRAFVAHVDRDKLALKLAQSSGV